MNEVLSADEALDALLKVEQGVLDPAAALEVIAAVITENLEQRQVVKNIQNAAQIASLLAARHFPKDPLNRFTLQGVAAGKLPEFSDEAPHEHAIYRGCACFASQITHSWSDEAPRSGGKMVGDLIEKLGYLPGEWIE